MGIPITKVCFGSEEEEAVAGVLRSGWVVQGPRVAEFEQSFANFVGSPIALATTSCTTALQTLMWALDVKHGDEVIVPAFTWIATANVVEAMGAKPVFCDIDLTTFNIDCQNIESLLGANTVGLIPVHLFGLCADMDGILAIASKYQLWVVEDAACGFGARFKGQHAGTFGDAGCFSFHPRKAITTGEGGMITLSDPVVARSCRSIRDHGASSSDFHRHVTAHAFLLPEYNVLGFNYRMTDIQAAIGCVQLRRAPDILLRRFQRAARYKELLAHVSWLRLPTVPEGYEHGYQAFVCLFAPEEPTLDNVEKLHDQRNAIMAELESRGIATRQGTHAPISLGYYREKYNIRPADFPNAYIADRLSLALPLFPQMTDAEQNYVVESLSSVFSHLR